MENNKQKSLLFSAGGRLAALFLTIHLLLAIGSSFMFLAYVAGSILIGSHSAAEAFEGFIDMAFLICIAGSFPVSMRQFHAKNFRLSLWISVIAFASVIMKWFFAMGGIALYR